MKITETKQHFRDLEFCYRYCLILLLIQFPVIRTFGQFFSTGMLLVDVLHYLHMTITFMTDVKHSK